MVLGDLLGQRRIFLIGLTVFTAASVLCGLSQSQGMLIAARFVQGAAAAVMMPASMALIGHAYPDPVKRARAVAVWAMGGAAASSSGPVLGGLLTLLSWRLIFVLNVPVGAVALLLLARSARSPHHEHPFDWAGQLTAVAAMTPRPITIKRELLAVEALKVMETHKITSVVVVDEDGLLAGVVHLHDLWRTQMF